MSRLLALVLGLAALIVAGLSLFTLNQSKRIASLQQSVDDHKARSQVFREESARYLSQADSLSRRLDDVQERMDEARDSTDASGQRYRALYEEYLAARAVRYADPGSEVSGVEPTDVQPVDVVQGDLASMCDSALEACRHYSADLERSVDVTTEALGVARQESERLRASLSAQTQATDEADRAIGDLETINRIMRPRAWGLEASLTALALQGDDVWDAWAGPEVTVRYHDLSVSASYLLSPSSGMTPAGRVSLTVWSF